MMQRNPRLAERRFYLGMAVAMLATVFIGFARTFYLQAWFPEAAGLRPPEPFFFRVHGTIFTAWMLLTVVQPSLVASRRVSLHRSLGWAGAGFAVVVTIVGVVAALKAAGRPGGFIGAPLGALEFLVIPLGDMALFAVFFTLAVLWRRDLQAHKRLMLLATIGLLDAGVVRWPFNMGAAVAGSAWTVADIGVDLFIVPMVIWDLVSRGKLHPVTLCGGAAVIAAQPLRLVLADTAAWRSFAAWAVSLVAG